MTKEEKKQLMRDMMTLDKEILVPKYAQKLKPYAKLIYIVMMFFLGVSALVGLVQLLTAKISLALLQFIFVFVSFIIVRMFCEFLTAYKK